MFPTCRSSDRPCDGAVGRRTQPPIGERASASGRAIACSAIGGIAFAGARFATVRMSTRMATASGMTAGALAAPQGAAGALTVAKGPFGWCATLAVATAFAAAFATAAT